jgi:GNAT superfamily N-acetyltransferase
MVAIEPIKASELQEFAVLARELCGRETDLSRMQENFGKLIQRPEYLLIGAKDEHNRLLGSVMCILCMDFVGDCRPFAVLENLIVSEKARGLGIGKLLVQYVEEWARERNCYYIMFTSLAKRKEAHAFYHRIGYAEGIVEGFKKYL